MAFGNAVPAATNSPSELSLPQYIVGGYLPLVLETSMAETSIAEDERIVIRMGDREPLVLDRNQALWLAKTITQKVKT